MSVTCPPIKTAPNVSKIAAKTITCFIFNAFEPIEVAKALAASLAPIPIDAKKENAPPIITIHKYIFDISIIKFTLNYFKKSMLLFLKL